MSAYLTVTELEASLPADLRAEFAGLSPDLQEQLVEDASNDVDRGLGGPRDAATGRALDLLLLLPSQVTAVRRATVEAACFRLEDPDSIRGSTEYTPNGLSVAWRGSRPPSPAVMEHLVGHELIVRTGMADVDNDLLP